MIVVVNVASRCGYTPQYEDLQTLYSDYKREGSDHAPIYRVLVSINNIGTSSGKGFSKKEAERTAAISLLKLIESRQ